MAWGSSAPLVMARLSASFRTITLDGEVRDGPDPGDTSAREVITIGYIPPDEDASAENARGTGGLGPRQRETYDVHCAIAVLTGNADLSPAQAAASPGTVAGAIQEVRDRAFALLAAVGQRLTADPTLGQACMKAGVGSWALREDITSAGPRAELRFAVSVDAFTTP